MEKLWPFVIRWRGKHIEFDNVHLYQCVDLVKAWERELNLPVLLHGDGGYSKYGDNKNYTWIRNSLWNFPNAGDIISFKISGGVHVGVVYSANRLTVDVFHQNWPLGATCRIKRFNYVWPKCIGWLRPLV